MTASLPIGVARQVLGQERTRSDQAHLASNHVPELRPLVETPRAKNATDAGETLRVRQQTSRGVAAIAHCTKLQQVKRLLAKTRPAVSEDNAAFDGYANDERDDQQDRD